MRFTIVVLAALLGGCVTHQEQYSTALPSLRVGAVALQNNEPAIAASIADTRLARVPDEPGALLLRGQAEAAMGENAPAAADFRRVLALQPGSAPAALGLARIITPADPAAAEALLGPLAVRGDADSAIWNNLGVARDLLNRHAEAQDAYRHAIAADPANQSAQANLARSLALTPVPPR